MELLSLITEGSIFIICEKNHIFIEEVKPFKQSCNNPYTLKYYMHGSLFFSKNTAAHNVLECYMHSSLLFSKNTAMCYILECYMRGSLFFSENTAVYHILECHIHGSSIQFVVFQQLSYCFKETIGFDK